MLPVKGAADQLKQTNEIKLAIPLLHSCGLDLKDKDITVDALLTQRSLATWLRSGQAHYHFTVKGNQPTLLADLQQYFLSRREPAYTHTCAGHGRIETRCIWVTEALNGYLEFPHVHQAFLIQRQVIEKTSVLPLHTPSTDAIQLPSRSITCFLVVLRCSQFILILPLVATEAEHLPYTAEIDQWSCGIWSAAGPQREVTVSDPSADTSFPAFPP